MTLCDATTEDATQRGILAHAYPRHAPKRLAIAADISVRRARSYTTGERLMPAALLLRAAERCDALAAALEKHLNDRRAARTARTTAARGGEAVPVDGGEG